MLEKDVGKWQMWNVDSDSRDKYKHDERRHEQISPNPKV